MNKSDMYFASYRNLEDEFLSLTKFIHCDNDQLFVYSTAIAELIIKCSIEIEAISKILYIELGGNTSSPKKSRFDDVYLHYINKKIAISKKKILISSPYVYLDENSRIISPLQNAYTSGQGKGCLWKDAYQALKHDLYGNLKKYGNLSNLIGALGALFILNLYLRKKKYDLIDIKYFDERVESNLFSVFTYRADNITIQQKEKTCEVIITPPKNVNKEECIYVIKLTDDNFRSLYNSFLLDNRLILENVKSSPEIVQFLDNNPAYNITNVVSLITDSLGKDGLKKYIQLPHFAKQLLVKEREAVLNVNCDIYPSLSD